MMRASMADRINEMHRVLKDTGSIYLHCDPTAAHYLKMMMDDVFAAKNFRDVVLDSFCGCGTIVEAAMNWRRDFIGMDISIYTLDVIQKERLKNVNFAVIGGGAFR